MVCSCALRPPLLSFFNYKSSHTHAPIDSHHAESVWTRVVLSNGKQIRSFVINNARVWSGLLGAWFCSCRRSALTRIYSFSRFGRQRSVRSRRHVETRQHRRLVESHTTKRRRCSTMVLFLKTFCVLCFVGQWGISLQENPVSCLCCLVFFMS